MQPLNQGDGNPFSDQAAAYPGGGIRQENTQKHQRFPTDRVAIQERGPGTTAKAIPHRTTRRDRAGAARSYRSWRRSADIPAGASECRSQRAGAVSFAQRERATRRDYQDRALDDGAEPASPRPRRYRRAAGTAGGEHRVQGGGDEHAPRSG